MLKNIFSHSNQRYHVKTWIRPCLLFLRSIQWLLSILEIDPYFLGWPTRLYDVAFIYLYKDISTTFSLDYNMPIPLASFLFLKFPKCVLTPQPLHFLFSLPTKLIPQHFAHLAQFHSLGFSLNVISPESSSLTIQDIPATYVVILYCISLQSTFMISIWLFICLLFLVCDSSQNITCMYVGVVPYLLRIMSYTVSGTR